MSRASLLLAFVLLVPFVASQLPFEGNEFNEIFDGTLKSTLEENMGELEPLVIPDQRQQFLRGIGPIPIRGVLSLTQLKLHGLPTFRRSGDSTIKTLENGHTEISLKVAANDLKFEGFAKATILGVGPSRRIEGTIKWMDIHMVIVLNNEGKPQMKEFKLNAFDGFRVRITGRLQALNAIFNGLSRFVNSVFGTIVKSIVETAMRNVITKSLDNPKLLEMIG